METGESEAGIKESSNNRKELAVWQNKLLPTMRTLIVGLAFFFFIATLGQLIYLHYSIRSSPRIDLERTLNNFKPSARYSFQERRELLKLESLILLEANTLERRHHHSHIVLMSSIWVRYLAFVTGMILAFIGAIFILGKLQESKSIIGATMQNADFTVKSSSPGIILVALGTLLIISTIIMQHSVSVSDASVYLGTGNFSTAAGTGAEPLENYNPDTIK